MQSSPARRPNFRHLALILSVILLAASAGGPRAETDESSPTTLKGKHARRAARISQWIEQLKQDRRRIYDQYGYPTYRFYELEFEARTEHWYYLAENREFVFAGDRLVGQQ